MKKYISLLLFSVCMFFVMIMPAYADKLQITGTDVAIRNLPNESGSTVLSRPHASGSEYTLKESTLYAATSGCSAGWYKINYEGQDGYVCASFARIITESTQVIDTTTCVTELTTKGFPQNYVTKLCELKSKYPSWDFEPINTGLDFKTAVENESVCGRNTINTTNDSYKDLSCTGNYDSGYVSASQTAVAYYMNPFNFFNEKGIFMFESNYANSSISDASYTTVTSKIVSSFMLTNLPSLSDAINYAARTSNISQSMISARIKQELGTGKATSGTYAGGLLSCICGNYSDRWGLVDGVNYNYYYNFFNIGVYDGSNSNAALRAVKAAKARGFGGTGNQVEDLKLAINGGASFIREGYADAGQKTLYFQKFNVNPVKASSLYVHQYMTNVQAASSESSIMYSAYSSANLLQSPFVFYIPIYNNMDASITNVDNGGTGESGENADSGISLETAIVSAGYKLSGTNITGVEIGTTLEDFKNKVSALGVTVTGDTSGIVGTGKKITISNGSSNMEYTFIVKGDTSGDGVVNALDLLQIQKNILGQYDLSGVYKTAADPSGEGVVNALDLLQVQKSILGLYTIVQ